MNGVIVSVQRVCFLQVEFGFVWVLVYLLWSLSSKLEASLRQLLGCPFQVKDRGLVGFPTHWLC